MAARKRKKTRKAQYLISTDQEELGKDSDMIMGKVRAQDNMHFTLYNDGIKADQAPGSRLDEVREELVYIEFEPKKPKETRPLRFNVAVPALVQGKPKDVKALGDKTHSELEKMLKRPLDNTENITILVCKEADRNPATGRCSMDFKGRVTMSSVKNIQLIVQGPGASSPPIVVLQFGKCSSSDYTMDVTHPLSLLQAFGIVISLFENDGHA